MVNPGVFHGLRKEFLTGEKVTYSNAVANGHATDTIADIQRRFLKRFPVDLPLDEEPSPEHLASVDDTEADPDPEEPDEESEVVNSNVGEHAKLIVLRKGVRAPFLTRLFI